MLRNHFVAGHLLDLFDPLADGRRSQRRSRESVENGRGPTIAMTALADRTWSHADWPITMQDLTERLIDFAYDFRMHCGCGAAVRVTAETYFREQFVDALVSCSRCDGDVHFGPAVALIRDEDDPALNDEQLGQFAWYHTTTWPDWPSPDHRAASESGARSAARSLGIDPDRAAVAASGKALHLGTYEAAVENMLRRMHDQADGASDFFLYRVAVRIGLGRIGSGYRDENADEAAQLSIAQLDDADVDAIRYLNVHEAPGSLSLALRPECIVGLQRLSIPIPELAASRSSPIGEFLRRLDERYERLRLELQPFASVDAREMIRLRAEALTATDGSVMPLLALERQLYEVWNEVDERLVTELLPNVSPVVADRFTDALGAARRLGDHSPTEFADRFAATAALLTRADEVVRMAAQGGSTTSP